MNALECVVMNYCWGSAFCQFLDLFPKKQNTEKNVAVILCMCVFFFFFEVKTVLYGCDFCCELTAIKMVLYRVESPCRDNAIDRLY